MRNLFAAAILSLGLGLIAQPAFACASPDEAPPPSGEIQRNPGTQEDCVVANDPTNKRVHLDQMLKSQASRDHEIGLRGPRRYRLVVACEDACTGIGVTVTDLATGAMLGEATGGGQTAVEFELAEPAQIKAVARMDACSREDGCKYGVGVYTLQAANKKG